MRTLRFRPGETIISEGTDGDTAFLIVSGSVAVSVGYDSQSKTVATLGVCRPAGSCRGRGRGAWQARSKISTSFRRRAEATQGLAKLRSIALARIAAPAAA